MNPWRALLFAVGCLLCVHPARADDFVGSRTSDFGEFFYDFRLTRSALAKAPSWKMDSDHPPLSPRKAYELALGQARSLRPEVKNWSLYILDLQPISHFSETTQAENWIYIVKFQEISDRAVGGALRTLDIPVYMDGSLIEPIITKNGRR